MKFSKSTFMVLAIGIFVIVLVAVGLTRAGQLKEEERVKTELSVSETRLAKMQIGFLKTQVDELNEQLKESQAETARSKEALAQTVISVDVTDKFFEVADYIGVTIENIGTSTISSQLFQGIQFDTTSINAVISGDLEHIVDFIVGLNDNFTTGFVKSVAIDNSKNSVAIQMIVYSYKGN
jgi:hypothetical protein